MWPGHGAGSACGKALGAVPVTTVGYERRHNAALDVARLGEDAFVDAILSDQPEPPTYFARMKRQNRAGPAVLGELPIPARVSAQELAVRLVDPELVVVDTRLDRQAFMARHLPGSLYARFDRTFNTVVGSLIEDETRPLLLVIEDEDVEEAVRDLVRIGYDRIVGYVDARTLERWWAEGGARASIPTTDVHGMAALRARAGHAIVDVRSAAEYRAGHAPGAALAPHSRLPLLEGRLPQADVLAVHCQTGSRSAPAAAFLAARGRAVVYVSDEWSEWERAGLPVERGPAEGGHTSEAAAVAAGEAS